VLPNSVYTDLHTLICTN